MPPPQRAHLPARLLSSDTVTDEATSDNATTPLLAKAMAAKEATLDEARPTAVARQHARGRWTARERIAAAFDPETFVEYGQLAQPQIRSLGDAPADGSVMGVGRVDGVAVCAFTYDYTVMGGSQSPTNHRKVDRMMEVAERNRWPVIFWSEGAGARATELFYDSRAVQRLRPAAAIPVRHARFHDRDGCGEVRSRASQRPHPGGAQRCRRADPDRATAGDGAHPTAARGPQAPHRSLVACPATAAVAGRLAGGPPPQQSGA